MTGPPDERAEQHPGPYLELFARRARDGWDAWGNEIPDPQGGATTPRLITAAYAAHT